MKIFIYYVDLDDLFPEHLPPSDEFVKVHFWEELVPQVRLARSLQAATDGIQSILYRLWELELKLAQDERRLPKQIPSFNVIESEENIWNIIDDRYGIYAKIWVRSVD